jgi:hypothetical protein
VEFEGFRNFETRDAPRSTIAADRKEDGYTDFVTGSVTVVSVLLGDGAGKSCG